MDFALTPEQEQFGQEFRDYLKTAITPELKAEMEELKEQVAMLTAALMEKRGRKPKDATQTEAEKVESEE